MPRCSEQLFQEVVGGELSLGEALQGREGGGVEAGEVTVGFPVVGVGEIGDDAVVSPKFAGDQVGLLVGTGGCPGSDVSVRASRLLIERAGLTLVSAG